MESKEPGRIKVIIPEIPPSLNRFAGRKNVQEYRAHKERWKRLVYFLSLKMRPAQPYKRAIVSITYFFPDGRRRDPDNYAGKMILDGLTAVGIIEDDSFSHIRLELAGFVDKNDPRTEITIKEV